MSSPPAVVSKGRAGFPFPASPSSSRWTTEPAWVATLRRVRPSRIKAWKKARITPVKAFKDAVLAPATAPKLVKGAYPTSDAAVAAAGKSRRPCGRQEGSGPGCRQEGARRRATARKAPAKRAPAKKTVKRAPTKRAAKR